MSDGAIALALLATAAAGGTALYFLVIKPNMEEAEAQAAAAAAAALSGGLASATQGLASSADDGSGVTGDPSTDKPQATVTQQDIEDAFSEAGGAVESALEDLGGMLENAFGSITLGGGGGNNTSTTPPPEPEPKRSGPYTELSYNTRNRVYMYIASGQNRPSVGMEVDLSVSNMKWKVIEDNGGATVKIEAVGASTHDIPCSGDHRDPCGSSNVVSGTWTEI